MTTIFSKIRSRSYFLLLIVGIFCVLVTSRAYFASHFFLTQDDTHVGKVAELNRALFDGNIPPRWSKNLGFGYGMPLFNFYASLPYDIAQIPYTLGISGVNSVKLLYIFNAVLAFVGMYLCASQIWGKKGGALAAFIFTFSTYRAVDLFVRGALGESYAMVILPFCLYGSLLIAKGKLRLGIPVTLISLTAFFLSHNLISLIGLPFIVLFGVFSLFCVSTHIKVSLKLRTIALFASILWALGLSAFYTIPAFTEKQYTRVSSSVTGGYFDFHNHFLFFRQFFIGIWGYGGSHGLQSELSFALGTIPLLLAVGGCVVVFLRGKKIEKRFVTLLLLLFIFSVGLCTSRSQFIWEHISALSYVQFPWRFLTIVHVFLALLCGASISILRIHKYFIFLLIVSLVIVIIRQGSDFRPQSYVSSDSRYFYTSQERVRTELSPQVVDYLPPSIIGKQYPSIILNRVAIKNGKGSVEVRVDKTSYISSQVTCDSVCVVSVNIFQFPGWEAVLDGKNTALVKQAGLPIYSVTLPSGTHTLSIRFADTPIRALSNLISILCAGFVLLGIHFLYTHRRNSQKRVIV